MYHLSRKPSAIAANAEEKSTIAGFCTHTWKDASFHRPFCMVLIAAFCALPALRRLQVTLSAAKLGARVGAVHENERPGGICLCIHRPEDQATWGLAREDARES